MTPEECADYIESSDLMVICAFRMAVKDLRDGRIESACWRIRSDMDKTNSEQRAVFRDFVAVMAQWK
jgi:hypothetical protein